MPDNATHKMMPNASGILEFREDNQELYVRANKTWSLLMQEKEVKTLIRGIL